MLKGMFHSGAERLVAAHSSQQEVLYWPQAACVDDLIGFSADVAAGGCMRGCRQGWRRTMRYKYRIG